MNISFQDIKQQQPNMDRQQHVQQHVQTTYVTSQRQLTPLRLPTLLAGKVFAKFRSPGTIHEMPLSQPPQRTKRRRPPRPGVQMFR